MRYESILLFTLLITEQTLADTAIQQCRLIADPGQRLSCYDAIVAPTTQAPVSSPKPPQQADAFGKIKPADAGVESIESSIEGDLNGWRKDDRIRLANGQVWRVTDDTPVDVRFRNPRVTVRRGLLGAYYLQIEGSNRSARVKRVQ